MQRKASWISGGETENIGSGIEGCTKEWVDKTGWIDSETKGG